MCAYLFDKFKLEQSLNIGILTVHQHVNQLPVVCPHALGIEDLVTSSDLEHGREKFRIVLKRPVFDHFLSNLIRLRLDCYDIDIKLRHDSYNQAEKRARLGSVSDSSSTCSSSPFELCDAQEGVAIVEHAIIETPSGSGTDNIDLML